jgi:tetratricopeptide (TPR) repeat protein
MSSTKQYFAAGVLLAAIIIAAFLYWQRPSFVVSLFSPQNSASSTINLGNGITVPTNGEGVQVLPIENPSAKAPSLDGAIVVSSSLDPDVAKIVRTNLESLTAQLKDNPEQLRLWIQLGGYRKMGGDYAGARDAWEYVAAAAPSNFIAFNNLGDLYMNFLKDYPKAEQNYKQLIVLRPDYIDGYRNLYTLYHYLYRTDTTAAADILQEGLKNNPGNKDLLGLQAQMKAGQ